MNEDLAKWLLAQELGDGRDQGAMADALQQACQKLGRRLARLITVTGYQALIARALYLARPEFPFLRGVQPGATLETCLERLRESIHDIPPTQARAGLEAVLAGLIGLLDTFIGQDLTLRLVRDVWPDAPGPGEKGSGTAEHKAR